MKRLKKNVACLCYNVRIIIIYISPKGRMRQKRVARWEEDSYTNADSILKQRELVRRRSRALILYSELDFAIQVFITY